MHGCISLHTYICIRLYRYIHNYADMQTYIRLCTDMHICVKPQSAICLYANIYTYINKNMNTKTDTPAPIRVGFGSQKGGIGKSTVAEVLASYLYYEKDIRLLVMDCDYAQHSFFRLRERDKQAVEGSSALQEKLKAYIRKTGKRSYRILKAKPQDAISVTESYIAGHPEDEISLVLYDLPGRSDSSELLSLALDMDYIISPIEADLQSIASCMAYAITIRDMGVMLSGSRIRQIFMLWNKVDRRVSPKIMESYDKEILDCGLGMLSTRLPRSVKFSRELSMNTGGIFRSTYMAPEKELLSDSNIDRLADELIETLNLRAYGQK